MNFVVDLLQFGLLAAAMAGLFHYVPNTFVRWAHAWAARCFVALAFEVAKSGLAWYVEHRHLLGRLRRLHPAHPAAVDLHGLGHRAAGAVIAAYAPSLEMRVVPADPSPATRFVAGAATAGPAGTVRRGDRGGLSLLDLAATLRARPAARVEPVLDRLVDMGWLGRLDEDGAQRRCCWSEPMALLLGRWSKRCLLAPDHRPRAGAARRPAHADAGRHCAADAADAAAAGGALSQRKKVSMPGPAPREGRLQRRKREHASR